MINWGALVSLAVTFAIGLALGGWAGNRIAQSEIDELREQHFHLVAEIQKKTGEEYAALADKLQEREKQLAAALDARDKAIALGDSLRADARRLREQADRASARLRAVSGAGGDSCGGEREQLARCISLLGEGADLVAEGAGLSLRASADKDAVGVK